MKDIVLSTTFDKIMDTVSLDAKEKKDYTLTVNGLRMNEEGKIECDSWEREHALTDWAMTQASQKLGVPVKYFKTCPPELQAQNFNYWAQKSQEQWLLRTRENPFSPMVRGVLSDRYSQFDNTDIMEIVQGLMTKTDHDINMWYMDDGGFHLRLSFPQLTASAGILQNGQQDNLRVGLHIENSEVGKKSIRITPMVYRLVCTNGLMAWREDGDDSFYHRHIFLNPSEIRDRVAVAVAKGLKSGDELLNRFIASKKVPVPQPIQVIEALSKDAKYSQAFTDKVKTSFIAGQDVSLYGLVNALTYSAQSLGVEQRVEVEKQASRLLARVA